VSESTTEGYTALHFACEGGHDGAVDLLLRHGADREALTLVSSESPLHIAAKHGNLSSVELLVLYGSVIDIRDGKLRTPLHRYNMAIIINCPFLGRGGSLDVGITLSVVISSFHLISVPMHEICISYSTLVKQFPACFHHHFCHQCQFLLSGEPGGSLAPMLLYRKQQPLPLTKSQASPSQLLLSSSSPRLTRMP